VDGFASAGALTAPGASISSIAAAPTDDLVYALSLARPEDDEMIRRMLRESAFGGDVRLSLEREPDSRLAASIEGDLHQMIVARDRRSGAAAAISSRSVRDVFLNGEPARLGYLGQLRIGQDFRRSRGLLNAGFRFVRRLHERDGEARVYLASVVADNLPARRMLEGKWAGRRTRTTQRQEWPRFEPVDTFVSLAIPLTGSARVPRPPYIDVHQGSPGLATEILACLDRNSRRFQFSPRWSAADLASTRTRGLEIEDFVVATRQGRVVGCAACWDQRAFKQVVVRGYAPGLARWRPLANMVAPLTSAPKLPPVGSRFQFACISHVALDVDVEVGEGVLTSLVESACQRARRKGVDYVVIGLSTRSAAMTVLARTFRHRTFESVLYTAFWPDGEALARSLDGRPSNPELAIL
jgi:hypothetical protein